LPAVVDRKGVNGGEEADSIEIDQDSAMMKASMLMKAQLMAKRNGRESSA
jgi:hypothetical protein